MLVSALHLTTCAARKKGGSKANCSLDPVIGPCKGSITKFYYSEVSGFCEPFNYGGCGGNSNKFDSKRECMEQCDLDHIIDILTQLNKVESRLIESLKIIKDD